MLSLSCPPSATHITIATSTTQNQKREKRANKDALLASDDDHHGDHIKQRQAADRINRLHPAPNTNHDLVNSERILPNNLASSTGSSQQSANNSKQQQQQPYKQSHKSPLSPTAADGSRIAPSERRPAGGPLEPEAAIDARDQRAQQLATSDSQDDRGRPADVAERKLESAHRSSGGNQSKKKNLWQNSLSRMSNKFSIFGSSSAQSRAKQTSLDLSGQSADNINNNNNNSTTIAKQSDDSSASVQVALDAWIETKVVSSRIFMEFPSWPGFHRFELATTGYVRDQLQICRRIKFKFYFLKSEREKSSL